MNKILNKIKKRPLPLIGFNEELASSLFKTIGEWWRKKRGIFASCTPPQQAYTPMELRDNPVKLGQWFLFVSLPMRGGINSEDAFRFTRALYDNSPELFEACFVKDKSQIDITAEIIKTASRVHFLGGQGEKKGGTLSYKMEEHAEAWAFNARTLTERWGGDVRNVFDGATDFEKAFKRVDSERSQGFKGMRRKIFSLLVMWLQEFKLIPRFPMPLIVDFHTIRILLEHEILRVEYCTLGPGNPKKEERLRAKALWDYPAVHITELMVNNIIQWSQKFLARHGLEPYDVAHGLWFLSRELCRLYYGNRSIGKIINGRQRTGLTERLIKDMELSIPSFWPKSYRNPCSICPVEDTCRVRIPAGPYYDWSVMVKAGKHIPFPLHQNQLSIVGREMPGSFRHKNQRGFWNGNGNGIKNSITRQLNLHLSEEET